MWGAYYPVGGSQRIAETLLATVAHHGGWTRIASPVDEILVKDGKAIGVRLGEEVIFAKRIVSAVGAPESKPFDVSAPRKVDGEGAISLVEAAA